MNKVKAYISVIVLLFTVYALKAQTEPHRLYIKYQEAIGQKQLPVALSLGDSVIAVVKNQPHPSQDSVYNYLMMVGYELYSRGYKEESFTYYQQALTVKKKLSGEDDKDYQQLLSGLASDYFSFHQFNNAEPLYKEMAEYSRKKLGEKDTMYIDAIFRYANNRQYQGYLDEAIGTYKKVQKWYDDRKIRNASYAQLLPG